MKCGNWLSCWQRFCNWASNFWNAWIKRALLNFALVLLLIPPGCSSRNLEAVPATPVLQSLQKAELEGTMGVWMNERDAGELALWINNVERLHR